METRPQVAFPARALILEVEDLAHGVEKLVAIRLPRVVPQRGDRQVGDFLTMDFVIASI